MQVKTKDYLNHVQVADHMLRFFDNNQEFNKIRHVVDKYFVLWLRQDIKEGTEVYQDTGIKNEILEAYHQVLLGIPQSSMKYFSPKECVLLELMRDRQYEVVLEKARKVEKEESQTYKIRKLQNQLDKIYDSTSWRMTAPFRSAVKKIKQHF